MVVVASHVAGIAAFDVPGRVREPVPDALALPVRIGCAFDLV